MQRNLYDRLYAHVEKKEFTILTGARQTGKTFLLRQIHEDLKAKNVPTIFLTLEDKAVLADLDENPLNIFKYYPQAQERQVVFIDEIQYLQDPSNFLKLLFDLYAEKIKIIATGSSAFYMDKRFKDSLSGRKKIFFLPSCSFDEHLRLKGRDELYAEYLRLVGGPEGKSQVLAQLKNEFYEFIRFGGYPAVILEDDRQEKIERLKELRDSFVRRDILEAGLENEAAFYSLFKILAGQSGSLLNINELSQTLKIKNETVERYLFTLQKCFHIRLVRPFFKNLRKELCKMPKVYLLDTGMCSCLLNNWQDLGNSQGKGALWETFVYKTLLTRYGEENVRYWRTADGNEVDFVLSETESPKSVEVKFNAEAVSLSKYKKFCQAYPELPLEFCSLEPFSEEVFRKLNRL